MKKFSERKGYITVSETIQVESMSDELRNSLWNVLNQEIPQTRGEAIQPTVFITIFSEDIWFNYFKKPIDSRPGHPSDILMEIRDYFFQCPWNEVYDFLEFIDSLLINKDGVIIDKKYSIIFQDNLNKILERELSGYRIVSGYFIEITSKQEIQMLQKVIQDSAFAPVSTHLQRALELFADRKNPDYRNSIKESISAVESMVKIITGKDKATLEEALKELEKKRNLHPAFKKGFSNLYGYTSDAGGIRHCMINESNITSADAKYFLFSCASFVNYLKAQM